VFDQVDIQQTWSQLEVMKYNNWAKKVGIKGEKVEVKSVPMSDERGLYAQDDIATGDAIVSVPKDMVIRLSDNPKQPCPIPDLVSELLWDTSPWYARMAYLLLAKEKFGDEKWKTQMEALPKKFNTPIHWSSQELENLQYPFLQAQVEKQRTDILKLCKRFENSPKVGICSSTTKSELIWALECVRSRSFMGPDGGDPQVRLLRQGLVVALTAFLLYQGGDPQKIIGAALASSIFGVVSDLIVSQSRKQYILPAYADMANHDSKASDTSADINFWSGDVTVVAGSSVAEGDEVFVSYGKKSNDALLQFYGFAENDNPNDLYVMGDFVSAMIESKAIDGLRLKSLLSDLKALGWEKSALESIAISYDGSLTNLSKTLLNTLFSGEFEQWDKISEKLKLNDDVGLSESSRKAVPLVLNYISKKFPTTLQEDRTTLSNLEATEGSSALRESIKFRIGKKEILERAMSKYIIQ